MSDDNLSLLEFLQKLISDAGFRDWFNEDPHAALSHAGLDDLSADDVHDALLLIQDNDTANFERDYNTGGNEIEVAAPGPVSGHHGDDHEGAIRYLTEYVTNNYVDDRDMIVDNSTNQQIDTGGGDFDQEIDVDSVVASGDGAVAAGEDIEDSTIVTGHDNQVGDGNIRGDGNIVGDGNAVGNGDGNTASFGSGDANSASFEHVGVREGGAIAVGGDAEGEYEIEDSFNETTTTNTTTNTATDSFNTDLEFTAGSHNDTDTTTTVDSHDDIDTHVASHNDVDLEVV